MDYAYLARERALAMAQADWHMGLIAEDRVIAKAAEYEAYLSNKWGGGAWFGAMIKAAKEGIDG